MNNSFIKKFLSAVLGCCLFISVFCDLLSCAQEADMCRYIVILDEPAVYYPERPKLFSSENIEVEAEIRSYITKLQDDIKAQIPMQMSLNSAYDSAVEYSYTDILNGFTITTNEATALQIADIAGVAEVFKDEEIAHIDVQESSSQQMQLFSETSTEVISKANSGNDLNIDYAYSNGYTGEGRAIAVLDTTLYFDNSCFTVSDENSVKHTKESMQVLFEEKGIELDAESAYRSAKIPFAYDYAPGSYTIKDDSTQHGTHVSGIAAANKITVGDGIIKGIAPEAQILFFGVMNQSGGVSFSVAAKALDDAVKMEVDAANLSFGIDFGSENSTSSSISKMREAVAAAKEAGISVNISAGNISRGEVTDPKETDYSSSDNSTFPYSTKVGSVCGSYKISGMLLDENGNTYPAIAKSKGVVFSLAETVDCKNGTQEDFEGVELDGKVAIIKLPDTILQETFVTYYNRAAEKNAAAVIFINNIDQAAESPLSSVYTCPVLLLSESDGERLLSDASKLQCIGKLGISKNQQDAQASYFTSYGVSDSLDISVDFAAPGSNIYSSYSSSFATNSGTSMAAPHITGVCALMYPYVEKEFPSYSGEAKVELVKNLLASTAENVYEANGALASVRQLGSGLVQLDKAMQSKVVLLNENGQSKITLGDKIGKEFEVSFFVKNLTEEEVSFDEISVELSSDDYKYYESLDKYAYFGVRKLSASVDSAESINLSPNEKKEVNLTVTLSDSDIEYLSKVMTNGFFVDGKVTLSNTASSHCSVGIPFLGFYGDWSSMQIIDEEGDNDNFQVYSDLGEFAIATECKETEAGYEIPFTAEPDETVAYSPLSLALNPKRNAYAKVYLNGEVLMPLRFFKKFTVDGWSTLFKENKELSSLIKNGGAELKIELWTPYSLTGDPAQSIIINFTAQNDKPRISNACAEEINGSRHIKMTIDGTALKKAAYVAHNTSGEEINKNVSISGNSLTVAFNVEEYTDAVFRIYDAALNCGVLDNCISIDVSGDYIASFNNSTINDIGSVCILAVYDASGALSDVVTLCTQTDVLDAYQTIKADISEYKDKSFKIFFLKNKENLRAHCAAYDNMEG